MGIFEKFKIGFQKSASTFTSGLKDIIIKKEINDKTLDQVQDYLVESDVGIDAADEIRVIISSEKINPKKDTINVKDKPPHALVSTHSKPNDPPEIKKLMIRNAIIG